MRIGADTATQMFVSGFEPGSGMGGEVITIFGRGLAASSNPNPTATTVTIGGVSAGVTFVSSTQLTVTVPTNAPLGAAQIAVTYNNGTSSTTATAHDAFMVTGMGMPPTISSVVDSATGTMMGSPFDTVTITGLNLNPINGQTVVEIDGIYVPVTSNTSTQIQFALPSWVGSGPLTVTTAYGAATANGPFIVLPVGTLPGSVAPVQTLLAGGGPASVSLTGAVTFGTLMFQGNAGDFDTLQASSFSGSSTFAFSVTDPVGNAIASGIIGAGDLEPNNPTIHLPMLSMQGTYSVNLSANGSIAGISVAMERDAILAVDGATAPVSVTVPSQGKRLVFQANLGDDIGIGVSGIALSGNQDTSVQTRIFAPASEELTNGVTEGCLAPQCAYSWFSTPQTGWYSVTFQPGSAGGMYNLNLTASHAAVSPLVPIASGSSPTYTSLVMSRIGQPGIYTFAGTVGEIIALQMTPTLGASNSNLQLVNPDGSLSSALNGGYLIPNQPWTLNATLPQNGTYQLEVVPNTGTPTTVAAVLAVTPPPIVIGANDPAPTTISNQIGGQAEYFQFSANKGDNLGLGLNSITQTGGGSIGGLNGPGVYVTIKDSHNNVLNGVAGYQCPAPQCHFDLWNIPATDTYTVRIDTGTFYSETFNLNATLSAAVPVALATTGTTAAMTLSRFGQMGIYTISNTATSSKQVAVQITPPSTANGLWLQLQNSDFSNNPAISEGSLNAVKTYNFVLAPSSTYQLLVGGNNNNAPISLSAVSVLTATPLVVVAGGATKSIGNVIGGQTESFTFSANAGDNLGLGLNSIAQTGGGNIGGLNGPGVYVTIKDSHNNVLNGVSGYQCPVPQCHFDLWNMPATDTYTVTIDTGSFYSETFSLSATLSRAIPVTLPTSDTTAAMTLSRFGQMGIYTISNTATSSKQVAVQITPPSTANGLWLQLQNSDFSNNPAISEGSLNAVKTYNFVLAPSSTYQLLVGGNNNNAPISLSAVSVLTATPLVVVAGGATKSIGNVIGGQTESFTFSANVGDNLGLGLNSIAQTGGGSIGGLNGPGVYVTIKDSHNNVLNGVLEYQCPAPQCHFDLWNMPATDTYTVTIDTGSFYSETFSLNATLSKAVPVSLPATNTATPMNLARFGQNGIYTISNLTAGRQRTLTITPPSGMTIWMQVNDPNGNAVINNWVNATTGYSLTLLLQGTYNVLIGANNNNPTLSISATLQ